MTTEELNQLAQLASIVTFGAKPTPPKIECDYINLLGRWKGEHNAKFDFRKLNCGDLVRRVSTGDLYIVLNAESGVVTVGHFMSLTDLTNPADWANVI